MNQKTMMSQKTRAVAMTNSWISMKVPSIALDVLEEEAAEAEERCTKEES